MTQYLQYLQYKYEYYTIWATYSTNSIYIILRKNFNPIQITWYIHDVQYITNNYNNSQGHRKKKEK